MTDVFHIITPSLLLEVAGVGAFIVGGIFAILSLIDQAIRMKRTEKEQLEAQLIDRFKERITQLETDLRSTVEMLENLKKEILQVRTENDTLTHLIQGKSPNDEQYRKQTIQTMEMIPRIMEAVGGMQEQQVELSQQMKKMYSIIDRKLLIMEKMQLAEGAIINNIEENDKKHELPLKSVHSE